jgi:hypothetical protein
MVYLSDLNRKKILNKNVFAFLVALLAALALCNLALIKDAYLNEGRYEIVDGTEYRLLYGEEKLTGSKVSELSEKYAGLELPADIGRVAAGDVRVVRMIAQLYGWELDVPDALSDGQLYGDRADMLAALEGRAPEAGGRTEGGALTYPIEMGYAEGWKNVNAGMKNCVWVVMALVFLVLVPVFNEDRTVGAEGLVRSARAGKRKLDRIRIVNALQLSALIYLVAVAVYAAPVLIMYGPQGAFLPIQGDAGYFLSPVHASFLGQFALNLGIGYIAVAFMAGIALLVSLVITDVFAGYAALLFIAAVSYMAELFGPAGFKHCLWNFSPARIADFSAYYVGHETYFGVPSVIFVPAVSAAVTAGAFALLSALLRRRPMR